MIQSQANAILRDLRESIQLRGYDQSPKQHLGILFDDILRLYFVPQNRPSCSEEKGNQVLALRKRWQEDRMNETGGQNSISQILSELEPHISVLPTEVVDRTITVPTLAEQNADAVLAELKKRGVSVSV